MESNKRIAIYCRVSTIDKGQTLEQQEQPLIEYCKKENWDYEVFKDFTSGSKESRPELDKMMQRIRNGEFDTLLVFRLDRLGRSLKHLLQLVEEFKNRKIRVIFHTQNIDTETPQGMFFLQILGSTAEFERQLIRERIKDKLRYIDGMIEKDGFYITKRGIKIKKKGRPEGSKDKKVRRKSGYNLRWTKDRQLKDRIKTGVGKPLSNFESK
jgi:DNA invertase Pin-like site-specific DNA recombinase